MTGANGFVGRHLIKELHANDYQIIATGGILGDKPPEYVSQYVEADLTIPSEVKKIDFSGITGVVHLAGLAAVGPSFDNPLLYITTNIGIETNLFEEANRQGVKPKFIVISSGSLYDTKAPLPITEHSRVIPSSPYAVSKVGQEQMGLYYHNRGYEVVIARPFNHFGPGQNLGFIVPDLTKQVVDVERGQTNSITVGNLESKRDYTDVRDIVRAYRLLLENGKSGEIYNICSGTSHSGQEMLDRILRASETTAIPVKQDPAKMRPSDIPDIYGNHHKLTIDTGWNPEISLDQTIHDVVSDWRTR